jgi:hypothetical protein
MTERWRPVVGYEGLYLVSDQGRVWACEKHGIKVSGGGVRMQPARMMKLQDKKDGRFHVNLKDGKGGSKHHHVHRLVLEAFVGPCPAGMECCHYDGNGYNNHIKNLRWDTRAENIADAVRHGTAALGDLHGNAKITSEIARWIKDQVYEGCLQGDVAKLYGLHLSTVCDIIRGRNWKRA